MDGWIDRAQILVKLLRQDQERGGISLLFPFIALQATATRSSCGAGRPVQHREAGLPGVGEVNRSVRRRRRRRVGLGGSGKPSTFARYGQS